MADVLHVYAFVCMAQLYSENEEGIIYCTKPSLTDAKYRSVAACLWLGWVGFILRPMVSRPVRPGIGLPFGAHDQILSFPFFSDICFVLLLWRPL
jgi:hypothetical protein